MLTWMKRLALALPIALLLAVVAIWWLLRGSLPKLDGELSLPGLSAPAVRCRGHGFRHIRVKRSRPWLV